jgi:hypothetical protein
MLTGGYQRLRSGPIQPSAWKVHSPKFAAAGFSEVRIIALERVMNLGEGRIEMRISRSAWFPRDLCFRIPKPVLIEFITRSRGKNIRTSEAPPVKSGDRQPEQQPLVVP